MDSGRNALVPGKSFPLASVLVSLLLLGCAVDPRRTLLPNQEPEVTIERPSFMAVGDNLTVGMRWRGTDSDGRVNHYLFASNPRSVDRVDEAWTQSRDITTTLGIQRRAAPGRPVVPGAPGEKPHIFVVRAVDNAGAMSAPATMAFFGANIAPTTRIVFPQPNPFFTPTTPTSLTIRWEGSDADGQITGFKYRLFTSNNPDFPNIPNFIEFAFNNPQAFLELYAPDFTGWDAVGADVDSVSYRGLTSDQFYLFTVVAFDDAGGHTAVLSSSTNMLRFVPSSSQNAHPVLCVSSPFFSYCMRIGGDDSLATELPADTPIPVSWSGRAAFGSAINAYRWVLDPKDPADEKPRTHPTADPNHWTPWNLQTTSATIGPFSGKSSTVEHALYIQTRDDLDRVSTLRVDFTVVPLQPAREILVVDDARLVPDRVVGGVLQPPTGIWPTAAELDTFLYARGGFPWRGYPEGTLSSPGLLDGYDFDTLGTRGLAPGGVVPLEVLNRYRQVIWIVDAVGATYTGIPTNPAAPTTSLRLMNSPLGQANTLAAYMAQGGRLWVVGGGAGYAATSPWQRPNTPPDEFTNADGELIAGRFMYDSPHWRSGFKIFPSTTPLVFNHPSLVRPSAAPGRGWAGQPNYEKLLATAPYLMLRTAATDPTPPLRQPNSLTFPIDFIAEHLFRSNVIVEDADSRPNHERLESTLDTLYVLSGPVAEPVMTYYHGTEGGSVVFSGFPVWSFQRTQAAAVTDFVLQDIWGLTRRTTAVASRR